MTEYVFDEERIDELKGELEELVKLRDQKEAELAVLKKEVAARAYELVSAGSYLAVLRGE